MASLAQKGGRQAEILTTVLKDATVQGKEGGSGSPALTPPPSLLREATDDTIGVEHL